MKAGDQKTPNPRLHGDETIRLAKGRNQTQSIAERIAKLKVSLRLHNSGGSNDGLLLARLACGDVMKL